MKSRIYLIMIVLFPIALLLGGIFCCQKKSAIKTKKFTFDLTYHPEWEISAPIPANEIFDQNFHYLKGGTQCYTFISEDQQYVLKFFKKNHIVQKTWLNYLPLPFLENYRYQKVDKHKEYHEQTFNGYKMAFDGLREESGLLYIHFNKTNYLKKSVRLIDREGNEEDYVDLDKVAFILQKKVDLLTTKIAECKTLPEAQAVIDSVLQLVELRCKRGLSDLDGDVAKNYGFIGEKAVQIDVGRLVYDETLRDPVKIRHEQARVEGKLEDLIFLRNF